MKNNVKIVQATTDNIHDIQSIAQIAWPNTYAQILSAEQIQYMMNLMYSTESLHKQFEDNHHFFLALLNDEFVGYMAIEHHSDDSQRTKIHKAYILPSAQGMGIGRAFFDLATEEALKSGDNAIYLNVNKQNAGAIAFYEKYGILKVQEKVNEIGNGYVMDDFVFEKVLDK